MGGWGFRVRNMWFDDMLIKVSPFCQIAEIKIHVQEDICSFTGVGLLITGVTGKSDGSHKYVFNNPLCCVSRANPYRG